MNQLRQILRNRAEGAPGLLRVLLLALLPLAVPSLRAEAPHCSETSQDGETTVEVRIDAPEPGARIRSFAPDCRHVQRVVGSASTAGLPADFDIYIIIDRSGSTAHCSGVDVDGDGITGRDPDPTDPFFDCSDPGDTILEAEIQAARDFVDSLSSNSRVAVVDFADREFGTVRTLQALTADFDRVHCALSRISGVGLDCNGLFCSQRASGECGPQGATDFGAALEEMLAENDRNALPERSQVALFLSDGEPTAPTMPFSRRDGDEFCNGGRDVCDGLIQADRAASRDVTIHTFAVGRGADSEVLEEISSRTGGDHFDIDTPGEIVDVLPATSLVGIDHVIIRNLTTGQEEVREPTPDGRYEADLDLVEGLNEIEVVAVADDAEGTRVRCFSDVRVVCITVSCPDDARRSCEEPGGAFIADLVGEASDDEVVISNTSPHDGTDPVGDADASGLYPQGATDFEFFFKDIEAGSRSCMVLVEVVDETPPDLECPAARTEPADGDCSALLDLEAEAQDLCAEPGSVIVTDDGPMDDLYPLGETEVTFSAEDPAGNRSTCRTTVLVEDRTPPSLTCPDDRLEDVGFDTCRAELDLEAEAEDNCRDQTGLTLEDDAPEFYELGVTPVTFTARDGSGNASTCTARVEVRDVAPPDLQCPEDTLLETGPDDTDCRVPHDPRAEAEDLCDPDVVPTDDAPDLFDLGDTVVTHRAEDDSGNAVSCPQTVTVVDTTPPRLDCPAAIVLETEPDDVDCAVAHDPRAEAEDNCATDLQVDDDAPDPFPLGTTDVTFSTRDEAGNEASCIQEVTVVDATPPDLDCPADIVLETGPDDDDCLVPFEPSAAAADNCDLQVAVSDDAPDLFPLGTTVVIFTARDAAGNESSCTQRVTVEDTTPPVLSCPEDASLETGPDDVDCKVPWDPPVEARDNCAGLVEATSDGAGEYGLGTHTVTWSAEDPAGNVSSCSRTVSVRDTTPPRIACPADVVLETGPDDTDCMVPLDLEAQAEDNCDPEVDLVDDSPGLFPLGTTTVNFRAQDDSGNSASCATRVTVIDTTPPSIELPQGDEACLWPPNHRFYCFDGEDWFRVSDNCDADPEVGLACLPDPPGNGSNQPVDDTGDGAFAPDCVVALDGSSGFCVRSERKGDAGAHEPRIYEIGVTAMDDAGNQASEDLEIRVDHDRKAHPECRSARPAEAYGAEDGTLPQGYPQFPLPGSPGQTKPGRNGS